MLPRPASGSAEYFQSIGLLFPQLTMGAHGRMGVVALHKHIETKAKDGFWCCTYPGGGVYDLGKALDYYKEQKYCEFLFTLYVYCRPLV